MNNLLKEVVCFKGLQNNFVYLRRTDHNTGQLYIEYAFRDGTPHDNTCLSKYTPGLPLDHIYHLSSFTCGNENNSDPDKVCMPGHLPKGCAFWAGGGYDCGWSYENPGKCACWHLESIDFGKYNFNFTEHELLQFLETLKHE